MHVSMLASASALAIWAAVMAIAYHQAISCTVSSTPLTLMAHLEVLRVDDGQHAAVIEELDPHVLELLKHDVAEAVFVLHQDRLDAPLGSLVTLVPLLELLHARDRLGVHVLLHPELDLDKLHDLGRLKQPGPEPFRENLFVGRHRVRHPMLGDAQGPLLRAQLRHPVPHRFHCLPISAINDMVV